MITPSDLIVVFEGRADRPRAAYKLADQGYAPAMLISPANERKLENYDRRYQPHKTINKVLETKARTTFENAFYTKKAIKAKNLESIILVTSWNHIPRSYLMLKLMLFSTQPHIFRYPVATGQLNQQNWYCHTIGWKMVYNEMLETWGSLIEWAGYLYHQDPLYRRPNQSEILGRIKKALLFNINTNELYPNKDKREQGDLKK
jgi:hypothetical protein